MDRITLRLTNKRHVEILGCLQCDTALLPRDGWLNGEGAPALQCPLCGWQVAVNLTEAPEAFAFHPGEQAADAAATPVYEADAITVADEDMVLIHVPDLLADHAFHALQNGVAPVAAFGWIGGDALLGEEGYRLVLVVRVSDLEEQNLFRISFRAGLIDELAAITDERMVVLVSHGKGVLFAEAGEVYLQALRERGATSGDRVIMSEWATIQE